MNYQGRLLGILIGTFVAGPFGAIIGYFIGASYDHRQRHGQSRAQIQQAFFNATFLFMGYLAKSDGRVSPQEIAATEAVMARWRLNNNERNQAQALFRQGRDSDFSPQTTLSAIAAHRFTRHMHTFINALLQITHADGPPTPSQQTILDQVCDQLGLPRSNYFTPGGGRQRQYQQQRPHSPGADNPYQVLDVSPTAKTADIRKKYRRLMSKNHPDKLAAKGASAEAIQQATEKTQQIRTAYETILAQRGEGKA